REAHRERTQIPSLQLTQLASKELLGNLNTLDGGTGDSGRKIADIAAREIMGGSFRISNRIAKGSNLARTFFPNASDSPRFNDLTFQRLTLRNIGARGGT